ncbi:hypothetical protein P154DRAFT_590003 [Amniculicola lignicola CBS 123094]|uniref:Uncharacterized protein n=1 Tax=Amniculicola lignicola CBS 123094 TaxID=1392246 RepID=A0A6A5X110_9PLEO|nr:hypothetical protein P154DRAFT_590003 [Amniculicola lignicola CBS 123094]
MESPNFSLDETAARWYTDPLIPYPSLSRHPPIPPVNQKPDPDYLISLLRDLVKVAQTSYGRRPAPYRTCHAGIAAAVAYGRVKHRIDIFFAQHVNHDFVADGSYGYCLEMKTLATCVEMQFGRQFGKTAFPEAKGMDEKELHKLQQVIDHDVDRLLWGSGGEIDLELLKMRSCESEVEATSSTEVAEGKNYPDASSSPNQLLNELIMCSKLSDPGIESDSATAAAISPTTMLKDEESSACAATSTTETAEGKRMPAPASFKSPDDRLERGDSKDEEADACMEDDVNRVQADLKSLKISDSKIESDSSSSTNLSNACPEPESINSSEATDIGDDKIDTGSTTSTSSSNRSSESNSSSTVDSDSEGSPGTSTELTKTT